MPSPNSRDRRITWVRYGAIGSFGPRGRERRPRAIGKHQARETAPPTSRPTARNRRPGSQHGDPDAAESDLTEPQPIDVCDYQMWSKSISAMRLAATKIITRARLTMPAVCLENACPFDTPKFGAALRRSPLRVISVTPTRDRCPIVYYRVGGRIEANDAARIDQLRYLFSNQFPSMSLQRKP